MGRDSRPPSAVGGTGTVNFSPVRPPREYALSTKRHLRVARDLAGLTIAQLATALGEHEDTVESWLSDTARNQVPAWIMECPTLPTKVRHHLVEVFARAAGEREALSAHSVEAQANVVTGSVGQLLAIVSEHLRDAVIDAAEARVQLPMVRALRDVLGAYEQRLLAVMEGAK